MRKLLFLLSLGWLMLCNSGYAAGTKSTLPVLNVYTYQGFAAPWGVGPALKAAFEKKYHCIVHYTTTDDAVTLLNRIRLEGKKTPADVVVGLDNNLLNIAERTHLFRKINLSSAKLTLPIKWQNAYFYPFDYGYFAFIYNKDKIKHPPKSMQQLLDSPIKWRIVYPDPRTSTVGLGLLAWINKLYGQNSAQAWKKLTKKTLTVPPSWSSAYSLLLNGEADFVLSYTTSPAYHIAMQHDYRYAAAPFSEGQYLQIETAGILATTKHYQLAQEFIEFLTSPEMQYIVATKNWMYPVIPIKLPTAFTHLIKVTHPLILSSQQIAIHMQQWVSQWQNIVSQ